MTTGEDAEGIRRLLPLWPAVGIPALLIAAVALGLQQRSISVQLVDVRRDLAGTASEIKRLRREVVTLRGSTEALRSAIETQQVTEPVPATPRRARGRKGKAR